MDGHHGRVDAPRPKRSQPTALPNPPEAAESGEVAELMKLQRTAGNRAVANALTSVQRHHLNPDDMR